MSFFFSFSFSLSLSLLLLLSIVAFDNLCNPIAYPLIFLSFSDEVIVNDNQVHWPSGFQELQCSLWREQDLVYSATCYIHYR